MVFLPVPQILGQIKEVLALSKLQVVERIQEQSSSSSTTWWTFLSATETSVSRCFMDIAVVRASLVHTVQTVVCKDVITVQTVQKSCRFHRCKCSSVVDVAVIMQ